jgi:phage-related protein
MVDKGNLSPPLKDIEFCSTSRDDLLGFPRDVVREIGHQLDTVQRGLDPHDWKPMTSVATGCKEIRVQDSDGIYRSLYVTNVGTKVYVLHCFNKKTEKTAKHDIDLAKNRLNDLKRSLAKEKKGKKKAQA